MTALLTSQAAAWAQTRAADSSLPIGSPITIVSDETVDARVRPGSEFRAHVRDALAFGTTLVAPAGTAARLVVIGKENGTDGVTRYRIAITDVNVGLAGTLPVRPDTPTVSRIVAGLAIPATTLAAIGYQAGKVRVVVPLPFTLSNDPPSSGYSPAPLRTAGPIMNAPRSHRRTDASPTPAPSASGATSPAPSAASATPQASAAPEVGPFPSGTNPPAGTPVIPSPAPPGPPLPTAPTPLPMPT